VCGILYRLPQGFSVGILPNINRHAYVLWEGAVRSQGAAVSADAEDIKVTVGKRRFLGTEIRERLFGPGRLVMLHSFLKHSLSLGRRSALRCRHGWL
jgi:hypothetical protein